MPGNCRAPRSISCARSRMGAATGLTGLDVCFWGASRSCCGVWPGVRALQKTIAETIDLELRVAKLARRFNARRRVCQSIFTSDSDLLPIRARGHTLFAYQHHTLEISALSLRARALIKSEASAGFKRRRRKPCE